ncbi:DUF3891 family protein [Microcoleus sp. FACHB-1515]|uniref:DUF3891 family protein n=1 Tax=Cyanophyceae TaxID=3028117 RepID=UPI0016830876|nr:DUF3891 family protein [Microcoleus sp. FACHB-1515]MBD2089977.1 DUF3891 family protein [Microcoleus sp. FACHB-1515]
MLHRPLPTGLLCITQPTHAWLAGQLARAWGNADFGTFAPWPEVCLGAELHDIGWLRWEPQPTLNLQTGYPHSFTELPPQVSVEIWTGAKQLAMPFGRYATLLVSLHGTGLFHRFTGWQRSLEAIDRVQTYLNQEAEFQQHLIAQLRADLHYEGMATPEVIDRNRQLVATWDTLSLMICMGVRQSKVADVPSANGKTTLTLAAIANDPTRLTLDPWPFQAESMTLKFEGRILSQTFSDEAMMRSSLQTAPWMTISTTITPVSGGDRD